MNSEHQVFAYDFIGNRYDVGEKLGFVKTTIEYALKDESMKDELKQFIKNLILINMKGTQKFYFCVPSNVLM